MRLCMVALLLILNVDGKNIIFLMGFDHNMDVPMSKKDVLNQGCLSLSTH